MPAIRPYLRAAVAWLLVLCATELLLRAFQVHMAGSNYTADPLTGVGLRPGAKSWSTNEGVAWSEINSHGYRDVERTIEKPAGVFRIAVLGDSITEARQVAQDAIFTRLMEHDLQSCSPLQGKRIEVLNFAVPGFGTSHEMLTLRDRVWPFSPDLVMLVFYSGNDMFDNSRKLRDIDVDVSPYFTLKDGELVLDDSFRHARRYKPWYRALKDAASDALNSSVLALTIYETRLRLESLRVRPVFAAGEAQPPSKPRPDGLPADYSRHLFYAPPTHPAMVQAWEVTEALLSAMAADVRSHGVPFLLVGMPSAEQTHPDEAVRERIRSQRGLDTLDYPEQRLAEWAKRENTPFFDIGRPLREYAVREAYLTGFANTTLGTGHLNELGHQVASELLSESACSVIGSPSPTQP